MIFPFTADDFGLTQSANEAIQTLILSGDIHRVSVLVNFPESKRALTFIRTYHGPVEFGLHFNLIEGKPVSQAKTIPTLVNKQGNFYSMPAFLIRLWWGKISHQDISRELTAQLKILQQYCPRITHLNSHQNIHIFMPLTKLTYELAIKNHIPLVRQESSVIRRLRRFPFKFAALVGLMSYSFFRYGRYSIPRPMRFEETSIHPGTSYD